jgi:triphosphatase
MPAEIELKLTLDPAAITRVPKMLRDPALAAVRRGRGRTRHLVSTYFDTTDWRLARDGVSLRMRRDGTRWLQTVKGPSLPAAGAGLQARGELEAAVPGPSLDPAQLATTPWRKLLLKAHRQGELHAQFTTDIDRREIPLEFSDGSFAALAIDIGSIRAPGRRPVPIAEIEIELEAGNPARLFEFGLRLAATWPLTVTVSNKAERGYALLQGRYDAWYRPRHARTIALSRDADAGTALALIARECLDQIAANAAGLLADDDPEWVHQMRIGTRRLRSCFALAAPYAGARRLDPMIALARTLAAKLGSARDWDVFALETLPSLAAWFAQDDGATPDLKRLRSRIDPLRRAALQDARAVVNSSGFTTLLLTAGGWAATPRLTAAHTTDGPEPLARTAASFTGDLLARRQRSLERRGQEIARGTPAQRHAVRIAAKKMRYAAEFFAPLFPEKHARVYLNALARLQAALGQLNDATTAARLAAELAGADHPDAARAVARWAAARATALEPKLITAWSKFKTARTFWRPG